MAQFLVEITRLPGSVLGGNQQGASFGAQHSIGIGVLGGMIAATIFAIIFMPVLFVLIARPTAPEASAGAGP